MAAAGPLTGAGSQRGPTDQQYRKYVPIQIQIHNKDNCKYTQCGPMDHGPVPLIRYNTNTNTNYQYLGYRQIQIHLVWAYGSFVFQIQANLRPLAMSS